MTDDNQQTLALGRIEGKIDVFGAHLAHVQTALADMETRLRRVERWTWALPVSVVSLIISALQWKNGNV